ncbi:MAG TPA: NADH-quinone oxidoreductase subunit L [Clostridia bacterium]|nr:NADH-quinone oxidoreductase subunit L [Clostridia bacterium]
METYLLLAIAILLPVLCAGLCSVIRGRTGRSIIVTAALLVMSVVAVLLVGRITAAGGKLALGLESPIDFNLIVEILDIALIVYIIYIGFSLKKMLISTLASIQLAIVLLFEIFGSVKEPEKVFMLDYLSLIMVLLVSIVGPLVAVFALGYMQEHEEHQHMKKSRQPRFFVIIFIFLGAMNGLVITNNLMWMGFFWEVTTVCSFLLISHDRTEEAVRNGIRALWINLVGGIAFVLGIVMIYSVSGTLAIDEIVSARPGAAFAGLLPIGLGMLCLAGFTKSAQFPFQSWLLGAMVAPTPVSGLLHSSTMVKAGVYLVVRFAPAFAGTILGTIVAVVGGFTFVVGSALAISQRNAKRVLAYSTIANLGLIICCAGIGTNIALGAAMLLIVFHAISKGLLFLCVGTIEHGIGSRDIEDMQGLMKKMPFTTVITVIGMISMLLPPFGVLMTKWLAIEAAVHLPIVLVLIIIGSAFTVFFWAKWIGIILTMSYKTSMHVEKLKVSVKTALSVLTLFVLSASILIVPLFNTFVAPQLSMDALGDASSLTSGNGGIWLGNGNTLNMGGFASIGFFIVLFAIVLTIPIFIRRTKPEKIKPPYMGGENVNDDIRGIEFTGPGDKVESVIVHNYYFKNLLGEERLTLVVNLIAGAIIMIMFGVVI